MAAETLTGLHAKGSSEAGDTPCSEGSFVYSTDVTAPAAPTVTRTDPESPSEERYVSVFGTAEADTIVRLYSDAACTREVSLYDVSAEEFAEYGVPARVQPGRTVTFYAAADDRSGNRSECSTSSVTYTNTAVPPAHPTFTRTDPQSPNTARELRVFGTAPAGTYVRLWLDDECTDPGNYYGGYAEEFEQEGITVEVEEDSVTTFYATAIEPDFDDRRGQEAARVPDDESLCSEDSITYSTDVTAPDVPTGLTTTPDSPNAQTAIKVKGIAEEGSTVRLYSSADCTGDPIEGSAAAFADPGLDVTVPAGTTKSFSAKAVDPSGNASGCSSSVSYTAGDTTPAVAPRNLSTTPSSPGGQTQIKVKGVAEDGSTVRLYTTSDCTGDPVTGSANAFADPGLEVTVATGQTRTFRATATDAAGNVSPCSTDSASYTSVDLTPRICRR